MYFKVGSYQHDDNTVTVASFNYRPVRSPRGRRMTTRVEFHVRGELLAAPNLTTNLQKQDDLNTKMLALEAAYSADYQDVGFYRDDGDVTSMFLQSAHSSSLTGNVLTYLNWAPGDDTEFCSKKTFQAGFFNEFVSSYSNVVDYQDTIQRIGTAGPIKSWRLYPTAYPQPRLLAYYSVQKVVHSGYAVSLLGYPTPPSPLASGWNYLEHFTTIAYTSPKKWGQGYAMYRTAWKYIYAFPYNNNLAPVIL